MEVRSEPIPVVRSPLAGCLILGARLGFALLVGYVSARIVYFGVSPFSETAAVGAGFLFGAVAVLVTLLFLRQQFPTTSSSQPTEHVSHWSTMIQGLAAQPKAFYRDVLSALELRKVPDLSTTSVYTKEGGALSAQREYLQVRRGKLVFHICGAPFANGFFVSWWLGEIRPLWLLALSLIPFAPAMFPWLFRPKTYYEIDTTLMFQALTHGAVLEVVDAFTTEKGIRGPVELERKPISRDFLLK